MSLSTLAPGSVNAPVGPTARVEFDSSSRRGARSLVCVATAWLAFGCAIPAVEDTQQAEQSGLHALVRVAREHEGNSEQTTALTAFVRVKVGEEVDDLLTPTNPELRVPETSGCKLRSGSPAAQPEARVALPEFLLADSVLLSVDGSPFELTPYAFPRVGDQMGGAIYSSRRLPAPGWNGPVQYKLSVRGLLLDALVPVHEPEGSFELPAGVQDVSVSGTPFESVNSVRLGSPLDLTWTPGDVAAAGSAPDGSAPNTAAPNTAAPNSAENAALDGQAHGSVPRPDWVVVDLESRDQTLSCAFLTTDAAGSIAESHLREFSGRAGEAMTLSVRLAGVRPAQAVTGFDSLRVRFEVTTKRVVTAAP